MAQQDIESYYEKYQKRVDHFCKIDPRELVFQNRVLIPFLEELFRVDESLEVVDVSMQNPRKPRNSSENRSIGKIHDYTQYRSTEDGSSPPDLLIARNWKYQNKDAKDIEYLAVIEVKSPAERKRIYDKEPDIYLDKGSSGKPSIGDQLRFHLKAKAHPAVILTDCLRWQFFTQTDGDLRPFPDIMLYDHNREAWNTEEWDKLCYELKQIAKLPAV